jgi:di/tricarboxylate transporter
MGFEMIIAFAILAAALVIFALEIFSIDFVAFGIMAVILILAPTLNMEYVEAISGFSNPATITVLAMFILSGAIYRTGAINILAKRAIKFAGKREWRQLLVVMFIVAPISMFINNTAAVAILIPMVIAMSHNYRRSPSKLLIPLSYTSQLAGVITLIGTSTNILASNLLAEQGQKYPEVSITAFGMFDFVAIGLITLFVGAVYLFTLGRRLLPDRKIERKAEESYEVRQYLTEVVIQEDSPLVGKSLIEIRIRDQFDIDVLEIRRGKDQITFLVGEKILEAGDILIVRAVRNELIKIRDSEGLDIAPDVRWIGDDKNDQSMGMLEVILGPNSDLIGGTLESTNFRNRFNCTVIAMRKHGQVIRTQMSQETLSFGDTLLLQGIPSSLDQMKRETGIIVTEEVEQEVFRTDKIPIALGIIASVVVVAALNIVPILVSAISGCVLMVLTGCLKVNELHDSIRWDVIFLLAGIIPLGIAIERTGGADLLANLAQSLAIGVGGVSPDIQGLVAIFIFYVITMILTALISNNAAIVVMVPVGVSAAIALNIDPKAIVLAMMFAASTSFATPVGYQTNTMVYGPGGYRFLDFLKVGGPLNLLLALVTPLLIFFLWGLGSK